MESARSKLLSKRLPKKLWAEAVSTAAYILNRTGPTEVDGASPYELCTGRKAPIDHIRIFGTECFVHVPDQKRRKLDAKSETGALVGYCDNKDGYRIYMSSKDDVIRSREVVFAEELILSKVTTENTKEGITESEQLVNIENVDQEETDVRTDEEGVGPSFRDKRQL